MKKIMACLLALTLVLSLGACGEGNTEATDGTVPAQQETEATELEETMVETKAPVSGGAITLEDVMNHPETPAEDLDYMDHSDTEVVVRGYTGTDEIVVIPDTIDGKKVTGVGSYAFGVTSEVRGLRLGDNVAVLNEMACSTNSNLEIFVSGSGLKEVGVAAFQDCPKLHSIILQEGLDKILNMAFKGCPSLMEVTIPDSVTFIEWPAAFGQDSSFTFVGTPGSVAEKAAAEEGITFREK